MVDVGSALIGCPEWIFTEIGNFARIPEITVEFARFHADTYNRGAVRNFNRMTAVKKSGKMGQYSGGRIFLNGNTDREYCLL